MKSENWLILELGVAIIALAFVSFFYEPRYEKAVWFIIGVLCTQFSNVIGYKIGKSMPQQAGDPKDGQSSQTTVTTETPASVPSESPK